MQSRDLTIQIQLCAKNGAHSSFRVRSKWLKKPKEGFSASIHRIWSFFHSPSNFAILVISVLRQQPPSSRILAQLWSPPPEGGGAKPLFRERTACFHTFHGIERVDRQSFAPRLGSSGRVPMDELLPRLNGLPVTRPPPQIRLNPWREAGRELASRPDFTLLCVLRIREFSRGSPVLSP